MLLQEMTSELINGILSIFGENVQQIILYGSVVRREETEESDIDIAIVLERKLMQLPEKNSFPGLQIWI